MAKQGMEWKAAQIMGAALLITLFTSFGSATPAAAADCAYGELDDGTCKCQSSSDGLAKNIRKAGAKRKMDVGKQVVADYVAFNKEQKKNPEKNIQGKVADIFCLKKFDTAFDKIGENLEGAFAAILKQAIDKALAEVCNVSEQVTNAVDTTLNNAFDKICIPLNVPDISTTDLLKVERKACNETISGSSLMKLKQTKMYEYREAPSKLKELPALLFPGEDGRS